MVTGDITAENKSKKRIKTNKNKSREAITKNHLVMRPVRLHRWSYESDSRTKAVVFLPIYRSAIGKKIQKVYELNPDRRVHLDEYGTSVWKLCNGRATVREIAEVLKEHYGEIVEPLYPRLLEFLKIMERNELIKYRELKSAKRIKID